MALLVLSNPDPLTLPLTISPGEFFVCYGGCVEEVFCTLEGWATVRIFVSHSILCVCACVCECVFYLFFLYHFSWKLSYVALVVLLDFVTSSA